jgi:hypothetical protein
VRRPRRRARGPPCPLGGVGPSGGGEPLRQAEPALQPGPPSCLSISLASLFVGSGSLQSLDRRYDRKCR